MTQRTEAKRVILELIRRAGGEFLGTTRFTKPSPLPTCFKPSVSRVSQSLDRSYVCPTVRGSISAVFANNALTLIRAWEVYDPFLTDSRVAFAYEPGEIEQLWEHLRSAASFLRMSGIIRAWPHSRQQPSMKLVPFDKALAEHKLVACTILV